MDQSNVITKTSKCRIDLSVPVLRPKYDVIIHEHDEASTRGVETSAVEFAHSHPRRCYDGSDRQRLELDIVTFWIVRVHAEDDFNLSYALGCMKHALKKPVHLGDATTRWYKKRKEGQLCHSTEIGIYPKGQQGKKGNRAEAILAKFLF